jgi:predicted RNA-binding protein with PUA-like domain
MAHWLMKTEPGSWSWQDQEKAGAKGTAWDGVRNPQAKANMMKMKRGDRAFFYHTGDEKQIVGVAEIVGEYRPDPADKAWGLVDVKAVAPMPKPVTLAMCKAEKGLARMALVRYPRLSVQPVAADEWAIVCRLGGYKSG